MAGETSIPGRRRRGDLDPPGRETFRIVRTCARILILGVALGAAACDPPERSAARALPAPLGAAAHPLPPPATEIPVVADPPVAEPVRASAEVRPGEPLAVTLRRLDLEAGDRDRIARAIGEQADLRKILPGEVIEVARDPGGALCEAVLVRDPRRRIVARFVEGNEARTFLEEREVDLSVRLLAGELEGSLFDAVIAAGGDANLTMRYADLLAWQVDFLTEPRAGDRFRILVYEERLDGEDLGFGKILAAEYQGARASARAVRWTDDDEVLDWYDDEGKSVRRAFLKSPLDYRRISSRFSAHRLHPILKTVRPHWGVDYAAPVGTPVSALGDGMIAFAGRKGGLGNLIEVRHNATVSTFYGHLSKFAKGVRSGTRVVQGEVIGYVGSTGLSTGPHLDFRVRKNGRYVDPLKMESPAGREVPVEKKDSWELHRDRVWRLANLLAPGQSCPLPGAWELVPPGIPRREMATIVP